MNWAAIIWLVLMVVFLMMEAATVTMVSLWFAAGALAAVAVSYLTDAVWLQITVFVAVSAILLSALRPLARKHFTPKLTRTNVDAVVGSVGPVTVAIDNVAATGAVKLGAVVWTARSESGDPIEAGTIVKVDRIEGVKAYVTPVKTPANL